jgi:hypothetical protein
VECLRRSDSDLVASRLAGASNRDQRPEVPGPGCRREENPHERMLSQMPVDGSFTPHDGVLGRHVSRLWIRVHCGAHMRSCGAVLKPLDRHPRSW